MKKKSRYDDGWKGGTPRGYVCARVGFSSAVRRSCYDNCKDAHKVKSLINEDS